MDALSRQQHELYTVAISGYESEFKNLLKIISSNDSEYNKLKGKCFNSYNNIMDHAYCYHLSCT